MDRSFMGADTQLSRGTVRSLGLAVAAQLQDRFPQLTTKSVAAALRCTPKTAENILDGHLSARTATMIIETFGPGFMADAVMAAAGTTLENFIRSQAAEARATAHRHEEKARELAQLETQLRASRAPQPASSLGRGP
jgi:plasmid maintenance system antidote protein VapI